MATGLGGKIDDVFNYRWGNIYRPDRTLQILTLLAFPTGWFANLSSAWMLFQESKRETSSIRQRHLVYMAVSFTALTLAYIKVTVLYNIDNGFLLPAGMIMNDAFTALIAIAIIKHQLFDITIILKKGMLYSLLAGILIFVMSFSEHILITSIGNLIGGHSEIIHLVSIAVGIAVMMPLKHRIEHAIEKYFAQKQVVF
jgi:hypothetical protein